MVTDIKRYRLFFGITVLVLFFSFAFNVFGAMTTDSFIYNYKDSESLVANQIRCKGKIYENQLIEKKTKDPSDNNVCDKNEYVPYKSQFGFQGKIYTFFYKLMLKLSNISYERCIAIFQLSTSLMSAIVLGLLILWVRKRFGLIVSSVALIFVSISPVLVGFSRNLYWGLPLLLLPLVIALYYYQPFKLSKNSLFFWLTMTGLLYIRYLCGYEYITTITIMIMAVSSYYLFVNKSKLIVYIKQFTIIGLLSIFAFMLALATHVTSLNSSTGSINKSLDIVLQRARDRTIGGEKYISAPYSNLKAIAPDFYRVINTYINLESKIESGSVSVSGVVAFCNYMLLPVIALPFSFASSFGLYFQSTAAFMIFLTILYLKRSSWVDESIKRRVDALFLATFVGFIGYCSWLFLAYSHSIVHAHINGVLIYLPFALFGFVIIGIYLKSISKNICKRVKK